MRSKVRWYSFLLIGLVSVLPTLFMGCNTDHVDNAQHFLYEALEVTQDLRHKIEARQYDDVLMDIDTTEKLINFALDELHDMEPNY